MPASSLAALAAVWILALMSPGPDFLAVSHASVARGRRDAILVGLGVSAALAVWVTAGLVGLTMLLVRVQPVYEAVKLAGAAYLGFLAFLLIRSARHRTAATKTTGQAAPDTAAQAAPAASTSFSRSALAAFRAGFLTNLGNPKAAVFFSSIFAALLPAHVAWSGRVLAGGTMLAMAAAWFTVIACLFSAARVSAAYARARRAVDAITGALFGALALELVATS